MENLSSCSTSSSELIWAEFLPQLPTEKSGIQRTSSPNTQLALLRTSRRIYREVGSRIYPSGLDPFLISTTPEYKYLSWITISNGKMHCPASQAQGFHIECQCNEKGGLKCGCCIYSRPKFTHQSQERHNQLKVVHDMILLVINRHSNKLVAESRPASCLN